LLIGLVETLVKAYISSAYADAVSFVILILVLLVKPSGLFGSTAMEKV
jgi:branched-chain amino acid transport system permease protein